MAVMSSNAAQSQDLGQLCYKKHHARQHGICMQFTACAGRSWKAMHCFLLLRVVLAPAELNHVVVDMFLVSPAL